VDEAPGITHFQSKVRTCDTSPPEFERWSQGSMGLLGVARANTAVGVSPETFLLLQGKRCHLSQ
jgi:hypothetical protein